MYKLLLMILILTAPQSAFACSGPTSMASIFFDYVPPPLASAPIIIQATAIEASVRDGPWYIGRLHVDKVIQGNVTQDILRLRGVLSSCSYGFPSGQKGFVRGCLTNERGEPELIAEPVSFDQMREIRKKMDTK